VTARLGGKAPSGLGKDALLGFSMEITLDGERLTAAEIKELLASSGGLALIRGRWVEVDRERLSRMLERFQEVEDAAAGDLAFAEAMRMLAGGGEPRPGDPGGGRLGLRSHFTSRFFIRWIPSRQTGIVAAAR